MINYFKSGNELLIIKQYISFKSIILIFLPIVFSFTIIEQYKGIITNDIENIKYTLLNKNNLITNKLLLEKDDNYNSYTVFKNIKTDPITIGQYYSYRSDKYKIISGKFSENIFFVKDEAFSSLTSKYNENNILIDDTTIKINSNISEIIKSENFFQKIYKSKKKFLDFVGVINLFEIFLFYLITLLIFFKKKFITNKYNYSDIYFLIFFLIFYFLINKNLNLDFLNLEFHLISIIILISLSYKFFRYE